MFTLSCSSGDSGTTQDYNLRENEDRTACYFEKEEVASIEELSGEYTDDKRKSYLKPAYPTVRME